VFGYPRRSVATLLWTNRRRPLGLPELQVDSTRTEYSRSCTVPDVDVATRVSVLARFGHALSDGTRTRVLLALKDGPAYPADLADQLGVSRQKLSNHLACLRGCGLVVAVPDGRRSRYEIADRTISRAIDDLLTVVLAVDPACCPTSDSECY